MQPTPVIPDGELDSDLDFIKQITVVATIIVFIAAGIFAYMIFTGDISLTGPSALVLEKEEDFDKLIEYDSVDYLSGNGVDVCMVDSGIDMTHSDLSDINLADWSDFIASKSNELHIVFFSIFTQILQYEFPERPCLQFALLHPTVRQLSH